MIFILLIMLAPQQNACSILHASNRPLFSMLGLGRISSARNCGPRSDLRGGALDRWCIGDEAFGEDDVREEIIAPILRALGYRHRGRFRVERSKRLEPPFTMIDSRKRSTRIVPDDTIFMDKKPVPVKSRD
jgi:hypothetical protein